MELYTVKKEVTRIKEKTKDLKNSKTFLTISKEHNQLLEITQKSGFWDNPETASLNMRKLSKNTKIIDDLNDLFESVLEIELAISFVEEEEYPLVDLEKDYHSLKVKMDKLEIVFLLSDELDDNNAVIEINPGAGGTESQDWAKMLMNMYIRYFEKSDFKATVLNLNNGEVAGIKNAIIEVKGENAYGLLKNEHGIHRLVRISPFDSARRRHTSFAAVKVSPLIEDEINIEIKDSDIKIDRFRSGGAGGQSVNTTDSAVRIKHLPTGIVVSCQNQRSQIQNLDKAMQILKSRLYEFELSKKDDLLQQTLDNESDISWGNQKRSYVLHPYKMVKDHQSNFESSQAEKVLNGELQEFIYSNLIHSEKR